MKVQVRQQPADEGVSYEIDLAERPVVAEASDGSGRKTSFDWDRTLDDAGYLRRCPVCGCEHLFARRRVPRFLPLALVAGALTLALLLYGSQHAVWAAVAFFLFSCGEWARSRFSPQGLICYRCGSSYHDLPIRRQQPRWDRELAERLGVSR